MELGQPEGSMTVVAERAPKPSDRGQALSGVASQPWVVAMPQLGRASGIVLWLLGARALDHPPPLGGRARVLYGRILSSLQALEALS